MKMPRCQRRLVRSCEIPISRAFFARSPSCGAAGGLPVGVGARRDSRTSGVGCVPDAPSFWNPPPKRNDEQLLTNGRDAIMCRTNDTVIRRVCGSLRQCALFLLQNRTGSRLPMALSVGCVLDAPSFRYFFTAARWDAVSRPSKRFFNSSNNRSIGSFSALRRAF